MPDSVSPKKQSPSLKARALRLLSMREYSRKGLEAKLKESAAKALTRNPEITEGESLPSAKPLSTQIEEVLDDFEARGWLSDERFAQAFVAMRQRQGKGGGLIAAIAGLAILAGAAYALPTSAPLEKVESRSRFFNRTTGVVIGVLLGIAGSAWSL